MILFAASVLSILAAGLAAVVLARQPRIGEAVYRFLFAAGGLLGVAGALVAMRTGSATEVRFNAPVPGGPWVLGLDGLSALFLVAILGVGAASAFFGVHDLARRRSARSTATAHLLLSVLVVSLELVVAARAVMPFLLAWEAVAIAAYLLIVFEDEREEVRRAGLLYIIATHAGTLSLFGMFALWGAGGADLTFESLAARGPVLAEQGGLIALGLIGFGLKAGMVPLHFWLPSAHAAAPSHVSAILSGVVIKMGIYGIMRVILLVGAPPAWWGWLFLALGAASGVLGVVWALAQHDLKRLLAYHSVENIGIILLGLGAGVLGMAHTRPVVAVFGFAGAALHTLNHALFKSLLFLGAGSVVHATGTREIDRLGGLAKRMPHTAATFITGAAAIVGLPPLNGFLSEWLVFRSLLDTSTMAGSIRLAVFGAAALALIGALALACFAKVVGVVFLGTAREAGTAAAHESARGLLHPLYGLASACILVGLLPALVLPPVLAAGELIAGSASTAAELSDIVPVPLTILGLAIVATLAIAAVIVTRHIQRKPRLHAPTWDCGFQAPTARMQYTASSLAAPILVAFKPIAGVRVSRSAKAFATHSSDPVLDSFVLRVWHGVRTVADRLRPMQHGRLSLYLLYIVIVVIGLLAYLLLAGRSP
ncbi:MAG: oxidoreductase [Gemmatimonadetes bacterium]|nr:oxidoreductase [Gemmatimonadota bacterium]